MIAIVLILVLLVGLGVAGFLYIQNQDDSGGSSSSNTASDSGTSSDSGSTDNSPSPTPSPKFADDGYKAEVDQCFNVSGSQSTPNLTLNSACSPGTYKVVQRIAGTTDTKRCGGDENRSNYSVYYDDSPDSGDLLLCLSYQYNEEAGSATVNQCVYGDPPNGPWGITDCQPGAFKVIKKLYGTTSYSKCKKLGSYRMGISYNASNPDLSVVLCMKYMYNDDAAYAKKNNCMNYKRKGNSHYLYFAEDCSSANAIVTGHTGKYDPSFCGNDGWVGYKQREREWKHLDYTVCWRKY